MAPRGALASAEYRIDVVDWHSHKEPLYRVRHEVFVVEQAVPESLEQDEFDPVSQHVLAVDHQQRPLGTGRLLPDGHIGRLAVVKPWRGRGLGRALMATLIALAQRQGFGEIILNAQTQALGFYQQLGFVAEGDPFIEANIPHRTMRRRLGEEQ